MTSILTNNSAMVALQTLKNINSQLSKTQSDIATGKGVANAKDNAAVWAISKVMETDQSAFKTIQSNLNVAEAVVGTARSGAEEVTKLLTEMKNLAIGGTNDAADFAKIQTDISAKKAQIQSVINASQMNGVNLLNTRPSNGTLAATPPADGSLDPALTFTVLGSLDRSSGNAVTASSSIAVASVDFQSKFQFVEEGSTAYNDTVTAENNLRTAEATLAGTDPADAAAFAAAQSDVTVAQTALTTAREASGFLLDNVTDSASARKAVEQIERMLDASIQAASDLGSAGKRISDQSSFVGKLSDSLKIGVGSLVDADMEEASARLQALQTQQQLGIQALSIANQAPGAIMSLFR